MTNQQPNQGQQAPQPSSRPTTQPLSAISAGKAKRRVRNYVLQPLLQIKIGLYSIILSLLFAGALALIIYYNFAGLWNSVLMLTDAEEDVRGIFTEYWRGTQIWVYGCFFVYVTATVGLSIMYTHKLVGPTIAFSRHVRSLNEGRYNARTYLRKGDAFSEVADELNRLSETLEKKYGKEPKLN